MVLTLIIAGILFLEGVYSLVSGKPIGGSKKDEKKYEPKSYALSIRLSGIFSIIAAVGIVLAHPDRFTFLNGFPAYVGWIIVGVALACLILCAFVVPKKVKTGSAAEAEWTENSDHSDDTEEYVDED